MFAPPPAIFAIAFGAGVAVHALAPVPLPPLGWTDTVSWLLITAAAVLALGAVITLRRARTTIRPDKPASALVTRGPFALTRNPMYLALVLLYLGLALILRLVWPVAFLPVAVWIVDARVIAQEERTLAETFRQQYTTYAARVRRWI